MSFGQITYSVYKFERDTFPGASERAHGPDESRGAGCLEGRGGEKGVRRMGRAREHVDILGCIKTRISKLPTELENKLTITQGERWWGVGITQEFGVDIDTPLY